MRNMTNLFDGVPAGFFNCLSSGSNHRIYADCLKIIYGQYDREISYRIPRNRIRDALAVYLLENHVELAEEDEIREDTKNYNDMAGAIIRRFCAKEVGWLEEDYDDATYEKHIIMTEQGILLAEFLQRLERPEREEFSSYIFNIYNILQNTQQWEQDPYVDGLHTIYHNAKLLSGALKRLSTFIKKIIERMVKEKSLESLTENILEYCDGNFIREYARLTKQQNIHLYRSFIKTRLESIQNDPVLFARLSAGCAREEGLSDSMAQEQVLDMIQSTKRFLSEDYDRIMRDIKHKLNIYLQIAVGRARFLRSRGGGLRGNVERVMGYLIHEMDTIGWKDTLPPEMTGLFTLDRHEFLDTGSLRYPRRSRTVRQETADKLETMTDSAVLQAKTAHEKEAYNPYAKEQMQVYLEKLMGNGTQISCEALPMETKQDLLCALSAIAYGADNGYTIRQAEGYLETNGMMLRRFEIVKKEQRGTQNSNGPDGPGTRGTGRGVVERN